MQYIIGVDLGTINSCVAYVDLDKAGNPTLAIQQFAIPQLAAPYQVVSLATLPSFCYLSEEGEWPIEALDLPWKKKPGVVVGKFAKLQGAKVPTRLVSSAKSWLSHAGAGRKERILPLEGPQESKISPLEASTLYLRHLKESWDYVMAKGEAAKAWEQQLVILTIPASFDESARALTAEAAKMAGCLNFVLLEEPQAAFYSWIAQHEKQLPELLKPGQTILVCDVGGGTTDFSLIQVSKIGAELQFQRMAVGEHLLLGGDNMDAALAHKLEGQLSEQGELAATQWQQLLSACRELKEELLEPAGQIGQKTIVLQGSGSSVIQGSKTVTLAKKEALDLLLNGFFGDYPWEQAIQLEKTSGLKSFGLPYEKDPSITKHLAHFLHSHRHLYPKLAPDLLLFNGGAMKPPAFQEAIYNALKTWFPANDLTVLSSKSLDLAVAKGAAYYGKARLGVGLKIGGGTAATYYVAITHQQVKKAVTILERGSEEGQKAASNQIFHLLPNRPVTFSLYSSHTRLQDKLGDLVEIQEEELHPLPAIHTILRFGKSLEASQEKIPVKLEASLSAIGTIELWLEALNSNQRWKLEFQIKSAAGFEPGAAAATAEIIDSQDAELAKKMQGLLESLFATAEVRPREIYQKLEALSGKPRRTWSSTLLRNLWPVLLKLADRRKVSPEHEARWWNLAGFFLRPGLGYPLDDFRMKDLWKILLGESRNKKEEVQIQKWICYRRIAAGLNKGQQTQLVQELLAVLFNKKGELMQEKLSAYLYTELLRAFASFEQLDIALKEKLGEALLQRIEKKAALPVEFWALARLGARHLWHGTVAHVVPKETCAKWINRLLAISSLEEEQLSFLIAQLARKTEHREINLPAAVIKQVLERIAALPDSEYLSQILQHHVQFSQKENEAVFGEELPTGLSLHE